MDEVFVDEGGGVSAEELRELQTRQDLGPLVHALIHLGLLVVAAGAVVVAVERGPLAAWSATLVMSLFAGTLFALMHEAGHYTAFRSRWLNSLALWVTSFFQVLPPTGFRMFHYEHHRSTQDPKRDPEIMLAPALTMTWPASWPEYLMLVSGLPLFAGKAFAVVWLSLIATRKMMARWMPYVPERFVSRVRWEARLWLVLYAALVVGGALWFPSALYWAAAILLGHVVLGFYLPFEHTGLPSEGSIFSRTRTMRTNAVVRFFFWNMPYHVEHHAYPAVPYHRLPALHRALAPSLLHVGRGYARGHLDVVRRLELLPARRAGGPAGPAAE